MVQHKSLHLFKQYNKNAHSSVESHLLEDKFCCQRRPCCYTTFRLENQKSVLCHNVNTQNAKIARRDRPLILASNRCEIFENLLHTLYWYYFSENSFRDFTLKNRTMIFISIRSPWICQYKYIELLCSGPRYGSVQYMFSAGKLCKFSRTSHTTDS